MIKGFLVFMLVCFSVNARADGTEMNLKIEGVDEYDQKPFKELIPVLAWSWGISGPSPGNNDGRIGAQDLSLTKYVGLDTAHIAKLVSTRKNIKKVTLTVQNDSKMVLILKDARFVHQSLGGSGGEKRLTENVVLSFADMDIQYAEPVDGKEQTAAVSFPAVPE